MNNRWITFWAVLAVIAFWGTLFGFALLVRAEQGAVSEGGAMLMLVAAFAPVFWVYRKTH